MENEVIENVNELVEETVGALPVATKDKPSVVSIIILIFAIIGVGSTVYFTYKGVKYAVTKLKNGAPKVEKVEDKAVKEPEKPVEAKEEPKAEEETAEK